MNESMSVTGGGNVAAEYVDAIIKANEQVIEMIETNSDLREAYERDAKKMQTEGAEDVGAMQRKVEDLTAMLFDWPGGGFLTQQTKNVKWVNNSMLRSIPYRYLRRAGATEVPAMIKSLRRLQLTDFSLLASKKRYGKEVGFALKWKNPEIPRKPEEELKRKYMEGRMADAFFYAPGDPTPSLLKFLGSMYADFFDLDDITILVERDRLGRPIGFHLDDPALWFPTVGRIKQYMRFDDALVHDYLEIEKPEIVAPPVAYIRRIAGRNEEGRTRDDAYKAHFYVRSEFQRWKRGYSIMEQSIGATTIILNAMAFTASNFSNNRLPTGLLAISGGMTSPLQMEKIKKILWANMQGASNGRRFPVVGIPKEGDAKWISIHNNNREMEFYKGITLFTSIVCSFSGTNPNELGLASFQDAMRSKVLNQESADGMYKRSVDTGLKTFINHAESILNRPLSDGRNVFEQATDLPVECRLEGLAAEDLEKRTKVNAQRIMVDLSINQVRRDAGLEPVEYMVRVGEGREENAYDIVGIGNGNIAAIVRSDQQHEQQLEQQKQQMEDQMKMARQQQEAEMAAQGAQAQGQGGPQGAGQERDEELINMYGEPVQ